MVGTVQYVSNGAACWGGVGGTMLCTMYNTGWAVPGRVNVDHESATAYSIIVEDGEPTSTGRRIVSYTVSSIVRFTA